MTENPSIVFVGAGLANVLAALRLMELRPNVEWTMIEAQDTVGGASFERTWSFHASDLHPDAAWAEALATNSWSGYSVAFPGLTREVEGRYCSIRSNSLHALATARFGSRLAFGTPVARVSAGRVELKDGRTILAPLVVDGRGADADGLPCGYQKFVGRNFRLRRPHGLARPLLMDATVEQGDGYRFVYVLPWSERDLLVEDTYYNNDPDLDEAQLAKRIDTYLEMRGWVVAEEAGRERGVLPIPLAGDRGPRFAPGVLASGMRAGRYHPTTGYSFAAAARFAEEFCRMERYSAAEADRINAESLELWRRGDFLRRLNNMMFLAAEPDRRWQIMAQFYGRDEDLIRRFYRGDLTKVDHLKLLSGRPPISVVKGLRAFAQRVGSTHA